VPGANVVEVVNSTQALPTVRKPSGYSGFLRARAGSKSLVGMPRR
jgi:hypothetical protein